MSDAILVERKGNVATVTLNRPHKLNALTKPLWQRLGDLLIELGADESLRCIVLRGAGGKAFSPGNDISEFETDRSNPEQAKAYGKLMHRTLQALRDCPVPTLALIEGICVGGGMEIAGLCDLRICGRSSRFGAPINRLGLVMAYPEIESLRDLVGEKRALEILLEGRIFGAEEAQDMGIVTRVVDDDAVESEAYATAERIADGAPLVARWHKKFLKRLRNAAPLSEAEFDEGFACYGTEDFGIGYRAFLAKEKPDFKGR
ncbi:enoyl-CoA hydratase/isomerase family protein [Limibacillus halophilus]|uniref:Enoyl-CoA hydratase/carnithine racemase n=1 Tax=Limibacillus halophilus TaxID=1579333 RepID=A0A839SPK1_9PROT|nr:enoyl-CoA hydratase-related protein [Limibacillus halophilus]MBB3064138.1 enoyl-CoA hydratase/carnithine racemase [Limibacillus halophilus]